MVCLSEVLQYQNSGENNNWWDTHGKKTLKLDLLSLVSGRNSNHINFCGIGKKRQIASKMLFTFFYTSTLKSRKMCPYYPKLLRHHNQHASLTPSKISGGIWVFFLFFYEYILLKWSTFCYNGRILGLLLFSHLHFSDAL